LVGGASIVAVVPIGYQPILDVQVVDVHNYKAAGVYHHNSGKSYSAAAEVAMHLTGIYPDWWEGKRFAKAVRGLAAGVTSQLVRDSMQVLLFGYPALELGHGMVPKKTIVGEPTMARSVQGAYDTIKVKHVSGGESSLYLRSYDAGRERVQALTLDFCWLDEEPEQTYFSEVLTRTNVAFGPVFMTFTPLKGMSDTVARFMLEGHGNVTNMTIHDVDHYTAEQKEAIIAQYPTHERDARINGIPTMGSGKVFPIAESDISVPAFPIPDHWPRLCGMDFGWAHPTAAVWYAHDRDTDTVYVYDTYRASETTIPVVSSAIKARGDWIPVAWPHDGHAVKDASTGEQLAQQYKNQGVNMRHTHAQFAETGQEGERKMSRISTEAGIQFQLSMMESGRFKVFDHLNLFFEEMRLYHRKDGLLVKVRDDLMSASRIGIMDLRFAVTKPSPTSMIDHNRRSDPFI
jgi:phage terminase large subunit-like protein